MRRKVMTILAVGALGFGAMAQQGPPDNGGGPGPFGPNNFGLCTAWAASETGRDNGNAGNAPPFANLVETAHEETETDHEDDDDAAVADWCAQNGQQPGNGQGNPPRP